MADELRVAGNKVNIKGVILEHKLNEQKGDDGKYINGSLIVKAGEFTEIEVKVYVTQFTKDNKEKKNYTLLKQLIDGELTTLATDKENPTTISIYGNKDFQPHLKEERYPNQTKTEVITRVSVDLGFGTIKVVDIAPEDYSATFDVEMFITGVDEEANKDEEETGRVKIKGYVPVYGGGIFPIEAIAGVITDDEGEFDFAEDVRSEIEEGSTINVWGNINFGKIIEKKSKGGKLGRAKVEDSYTYIHELIAIGADFIEDDNAYEEEDIEKAVKERKIQLEEVLTKAKQKEEEGSKGKSKGLGKKSEGASKDKPKRNINF